MCRDGQHVQQVIPFVCSIRPLLLLHVTPPTHTLEYKKDRTTLTIKSVFCTRLERSPGIYTYHQTQFGVQPYPATRKRERHMWETTWRHFQPTTGPQAAMHAYSSLSFDEEGPDLRVSIISLTTQDHLSTHPPRPAFHLLYGPPPNSSLFYVTCSFSFWGGSA